MQFSDFVVLTYDKCCAYQKSHQVKISEIPFDIYYQKTISKFVPQSIFKATLPCLPF